MKPEQKLWTKLNRRLKKHWDATRHEDSSTHGTPDVSWGSLGVNGWLELKVVDLPKNSDDIVQVDLRPAQLIFLVNRIKHGGPCAVFLEALHKKKYYYFLVDDRQSLMKLASGMKKSEFLKFCINRDADLSGLPPVSDLLRLLAGQVDRVI